MSRANRSGISLSADDVKLVLGMEGRGDRNHDIAAWFGVNQGRIAEAKKGDYGTLEAAPEADLPPSGPPGLKGRALLETVEKVLISLSGRDDNSAKETTEALNEAVERFYTNE